MRTIIFIAIFILSGSAKAQNDLHVSHYMFNTLIYNPAAAGNSPSLQATLLARKQWTGVTGAPTIGLLSAHSYFDKLKGGVGLVLAQDKIGFESITTFRANYSYHIKLKEGHTLALGLGAGFIYKSINTSKLIFDQSNDQSITNLAPSKITPDFNFGLEYNNKNLQVGAATTHLQQGISNSGIYNIPRHHFVYARYYYHANEKLIIVPSLLIKSSGYITQVELNTSAVFNNKFWIGATWRSKEAVVGLVGIAFNSSLRMGYSYDYTGLSKISNYSNGTHEICLIYTGKAKSNKQNQLKNPRFFN